MAETLTVNTDPSTETATDTTENLTPEEQDSLKVGEEIQNQQEQLLAGKYRTAEELEKAYGELERKLGAQDNQDSSTTDETPVQETEQVSEETPEVTETFKENNYYLENGSVNYEEANNIYGDKLGEVFKDNNIDPFAINDYFQANNGTISTDHYNQLEKAGLSRQIVDAYLAGQNEAMTSTPTNEAADISDATVTEIKNFAGGEEAYSNMVNWASNNLDQNSVEAFDSIVNSGSTDAIKLAVTGLKSKYEDATGRDGNLITGKAPKPQTDGYRSQAELVAAMNDRRYDNDPAYRQDVIAKLERSGNLNF